MQDRHPVGVIDIGSNSVRLVIYEGNARALTVLFNEKVLSGLGRGLSRANRLDPQAVASALAALRRFRRLSEQAGVGQLYALATAAAREAENGREFVVAAEEALGRSITILSGADEARYAAEGVLAGFHRPGGIGGDLGGGSLELVDIHDGGFEGGLTLPLGGLRLQELADGRLDRAQEITDSHLAGCSLAGKGRGRSFFGVGGTWRNLAKLHMTQIGYPLHVMHGYAMDPREIRGFLDTVIESEPEDLPGIRAVSKSRRALLGYGAVTLKSVIRHIRPDTILMSALGVREGFLFAQLPEAEWAKDPLIEAARELAILRSRSPRHAEELIEWSRRTFEALDIDETPEEERLRVAACLLADIGWRAHPDYRGKESLTLIEHAAFPAVDHRGRAYLGLTNYYRHEATFEQSHLPELEQLVGERLLRRARLLASLFRVTYLLTAAMPGVIERLRWVQDPRGGFTLVVPGDLAELVGERPEGRLQQFAKVVETALRLEAGPA